MVHDDDKASVLKLLQGALDAQSQQDLPRVEREGRTAWRMAAARVPLLRCAELSGVVLESWNAPRRTNRAQALVWTSEFDEPTLVAPLKSLIEAVQSDALTLDSIVRFDTIASVVHTRLKVDGATNVIGYDVPDDDGAVMWRDIDTDARRAEALA